MSGQSEDSLSLEGIPDIAVEVIVSGKEVSPRDREGDRGDSTEDGIVGVLHQISIGTNVKQSARGIVGSGSKSHSIGEEGDGVDVAVVSSEGLDALASPHVPQLGGGIASSRDEGVLVVGVDRQAHDVSIVVRELHHLDVGFDIPEDAGHVSRGGDDSSVIQKSAAREISGVGVELPVDPDGNLLGPQIIYGADVIQSSAGDK